METISRAASKYKCKVTHVKYPLLTAAAFEAPSMVCIGGGVGATELLDPDKGMVVSIDFKAMDSDSAAERVLEILGDRAALRQVWLLSSVCVRWCMSSFSKTRRSLSKKTMTERPPDGFVSYMQQTNTIILTHAAHHPY